VQRPVRGCFYSMLLRLGCVMYGVRVRSESLL